MLSTDRILERVLLKLDNIGELVRTVQDHLQWFQYLKKTFFKPKIFEK